MKLTQPLCINTSGSKPPFLRCARAVIKIEYPQHQPVAQDRAESRPAESRPKGLALVKGQVVLESADLPEGAEVTVFISDPSAPVRLAPDLQAELEEALDEADRTKGITAEDLFEQLRKYG